MSENECRNSMQELDDLELENISGGRGGGQSVFMDEERLPLHWNVTCARCRKVFQVGSNKSCPSCGNLEVELTY